MIGLIINYHHNKLKSDLWLKPYKVVDKKRIQLCIKKNIFYAHLIRSNNGTCKQFKMQGK